MSAERDELARELFIADNFNQSREASIADWEHFIAEDKFHRGVEHYKTMAAAVLALGYTRRSDTPESIRSKHLAYTVVARKLRVQTKRGSAGATAKPQATTPAKDA